VESPKVASGVRRVMVCSEVCWQVCRETSWVVDQHSCLLLQKEETCEGQNYDERWGRNLRCDERVIPHVTEDVMPCICLPRRLLLVPPLIVQRMLG
jgi:hypothetical protein